MAEFLGKQISDEQLRALIEYISFENLKNNDSCQITIDYFTPEMIFFNKGKFGYWKEYLNKNLSDKVDEMVKKYLKYNKKPIKYEPSIHYEIKKTE